MKNGFFSVIGKKVFVPFDGRTVEIRDVYNLSNEPRRIEIEKLNQTAPVGFWGFVWPKPRNQ